MDLKRTNNTYHFKLPTKKPMPKGPPAAFLSTLRSAEVAEGNSSCGTSNCNGHGSCNDGQCECEVDYFGTACTSFCPLSCSMHGDCIHGSCLCYGGFAGPACDQITCCNGHGSCDKPGTCECDEGWNGEDCSIQLICPDPTCSGQGVCKDGRCMCGAGFSGPSCNLDRPSCEDKCGDHGTCNVQNELCDCRDGYTGRTCQIDTGMFICPTGTHGGACNGNGNCMDGICSCWPGYDGDACNISTPLPGTMLTESPCSGKDGLSLLDCAGLQSHMATTEAHNQSATASLAQTDAAPVVDDEATRRSGFNSPLTSDWMQPSPGAMAALQMSSAAAKTASQDEINGGSLQRPDAAWNSAALRLFASASRVVAPQGSPIFAAAPQDLTAAPREMLAAKPKMSLLSAAVEVGKRSEASSEVSLDQSSAESSEAIAEESSTESSLDRSEAEAAIEITDDWDPTASIDAVLGSDDIAVEVA